MRLKTGALCGRGARVRGGRFRAPGAPGGGRRARRRRRDRPGRRPGGERPASSRAAPAARCWEAAPARRDGSFALAAGAPPSRVEVGCAYCLDRTVGLTPGEPALVIVRRFRALRERGAPAPEDFAALPPQTLAGAAGLIPFAVAGRSGVSDRGLALGRDASAGRRRAALPPHRRHLAGRSSSPRSRCAGSTPFDGAFEAGLASAGAPALRAATGPAGGGCARAGRRARGAAGGLPATAPTIWPRPPRGCPSRAGR